MGSRQSSERRKSRRANVVLASLVLTLVGCGGDQALGDFDNDGLPYYCEPGYAGSIPCNGDERGPSGTSEKSSGLPSPPSDPPPARPDDGIVSCSLHCVQDGDYVAPPGDGEPCAFGTWERQTGIAVDTRGASVEYECYGVGE